MTHVYFHISRKMNSMNRYAVELGEANTFTQYFIFSSPYSKWICHKTL